MYTTDQQLQAINSHLATLTDGRSPRGLYDPVSYVLSLGGKRIRPMLMLLAYGLWRDDPDSIMPQACGIEVYHNYTLLHDDLMDHADRRRGHPTVHRRWDANTAILSGDSMLVMAYELMMKHPETSGETPNGAMSEALHLFTRTALEIGEGQQYDMDFERRDDVTEEEYIEMIRLKTGVLLACALKMGALLAGAPPADADALYTFGEKVGLAFQLQDDYLDVYGDPAVFGKNIGGDILSNKKTYMLINALNRAEGATLDELRRWIDTDGTHDTSAAAAKIAGVTAIYDRLGIDRLATDKIAFYFDESRRYLSAVALPEERKAALAAYTDTMVQRRR